MSLNFFNEDVYLKLNADVRDAVSQDLITAQQHFEQFGRDEGRMASHLFDPDEYLQLHLDVAEAVANGVMNVYHHFETWGLGESRAPFAAFDVDYYLEQNPDVAALVRDGVMSAVEHFVQYGHNEVRNFNPDYDMAEFLANNPQAAEAVSAGTLSVAEAWVQFYSNAFTGIEWPADNGGDTGGDTGGGAIDGSQFDYDAIIAMIEAMGFSAVNVEEMQKLVLDSGLLAPENLNDDGTGLKDPMPLVELILEHFYGDGGVTLVGALPDLGMVDLMAG